MQPLSNDTASWSLIDAPLAAPLFYNSNTYDTIGNVVAAVIGDFQSPLLPLTFDSLSTDAPQSLTLEAHTVNYWAFVLIFFPLFTIFGNVLVVVSVYREKSLHNVTNYFVVSLAISDITVAALVMPFAIYLEFNRFWALSERLCDFWVAADCMACTASILNLVAIAVDRYIAVTKPLKYARHKNSKRVTIMIFMVWLVSFCIALPIVSGVNKSDVAQYPRVPEQCAFFNNKFLIFSSIGSFFIPCILIFAIYYRIFMVIMARARQSRKQWRPKAVIESAAAQHRTNANHLVTSFLQDRQETNAPKVANDTTEITAMSTKPKKTLSTIAETTPSENNANDRNALMLQLSTAVLTPAVRASINVTSSSGDQLDDDERDDIALFVQQEQRQLINKNSNNNHRQDPHENQIEILSTTPFDTMGKDDLDPDADPELKNNTRSSQTENHLPCHFPAKRMKIRLKAKANPDGAPLTTSTAPDNTVKIAKRKAYSRMKKERKATQTLIIVLICFLFCWLPFFVLNNLVNAIVKLSNKSDALLISDFVLSLCVWLGYINSFLNPIIYTIFNMEFRKAFAKILFSSCAASTAASS